MVARSRTRRFIAVVIIWKKGDRSGLAGKFV